MNKLIVIGILATIIGLMFWFFLTVVRKQANELDKKGWKGRRISAMKKFNKGKGY